MANEEIIFREILDVGLGCDGVKVTSNKNVKFNLLVWKFLKYILFGLGS